jgi:SAM-dependent methyltransferase
MARYGRCRYRQDTLDELCRKGRAELDRNASRIRARGVVAGARLLGIGSYGGAFLELAHEAGCRVTGIDINADVVAHCRALGSDVRCEAFEPRRFEVDEFDGVWILNCFEQLPDHARVLAGAARVLRPGRDAGDPNPECGVPAAPLWTRGGALLRSVARANALLGMPFAKCFSAAALIRAIEEHGLTVERGDNWRICRFSPDDYLEVFDEAPEGAPAHDLPPPVGSLAPTTPPRRSPRPPRGCERPQASLTLPPASRTPRRLARSARLQQGEVAYAAAAR